MATRWREDALFSLNTAIDALDLARVSSITPTKAAFDSARVFLATIRVRSFRSMLVNCWMMHTGLNGQRSGIHRTGATPRWRS